MRGVGEKKRYGKEIEEQAERVRANELGRGHVFVHLPTPRTKPEVTTGLRADHRQPESSLLVRGLKLASGAYGQG